MLDDEAALREALQLPADAKIPTIRQVQNDPKGAIGKLVSKAATVVAGSGDEVKTSFLPSLGRIACCLNPSRCRHGKETGFEEFVEDLRHEFRTIIPAGS